MKEREYLRLKRQIESEYRQKMEALELVWRMSGKPAERTERLPRAAVQQSVRGFLDEWTGGEFSLDEVIRRIRQDSSNAAVNRASVSGALRRLVRRGELQVVSRGMGNKPSRYRRVKDGEEAA